MSILLSEMREMSYYLSMVPRLLLDPNSAEPQPQPQPRHIAINAAKNNLVVANDMVLNHDVWILAPRLGHYLNECYHIATIKPAVR